MSILEEIKQMQQQGLGEMEISQKLREEGYSPREIDDAISQSKIKSAIYEEEQEMQPSVMTQEITPAPEQGAQAQEYAYQTPQAYPQGEGYYPQQTEISHELITEIAEQIMNEKISEIKKALSNVVEFKTFVEAKISDIDSRLKRIEAIIEKLQLAILGKIGEYAQSINDIKDEIGMMQESFSKLANPFISKTREEIEEEKPEEIESKEEETEEAKKPEEISEKKQKRKSKKPSFEDYLR